MRIPMGRLTGSGSFAAVVTILAITLVACSETGTPPGPRPEPVVVYASYADQDFLPGLFERFTDETGMPVTIRYADEQENVARVVANRGAPPADVLLVPTISAIWLAAEEGALIPQRSAVIDAAVPDWLRDPDYLWTATGFRLGVIVYDPQAIDPDAGIDYASLAEPEYQGRLCLSSAQLSVNRALIAMLIDSLGRRPAELLVRGWIRNLGHPVFDSEAQLLEAILDGRCGAGIVSSSAVAETDPERLGIRVPATAALDAEAAGIARHARHPDAALTLIEWLVGKTAQPLLAAGNRHYPANPAADSPSGADRAGRNKAATTNSGRIGRNNEEALKLAERAAYR